MSTTVCSSTAHRFDEAEAALRHALEIDLDYQLAQENLLDLSTIR